MTTSFQITERDDGADFITDVSANEIMALFDSVQVNGESAWTAFVVGAALHAAIGSHAEGRC
jgi:hypothetical protein